MGVTQGNNYFARHLPKEFRSQKPHSPSCPRGLIEFSNLLHLARHFPPLKLPLELGLRLGRDVAPLLHPVQNLPLSILERAIRLSPIRDRSQADSVFLRKLCVGGDDLGNPRLAQAMYCSENLLLDFRPVWSVEIISGIRTQLPELCIGQRRLDSAKGHVPPLPELDSCFPRRSHATQYAKVTVEQNEDTSLKVMRNCPSCATTHYLSFVFTSIRSRGCTVSAVVEIW